MQRLIKDLRNESWQMRWDAAVAWALGQIDDPRVLEPLVDALKDESHGVRKNAILSLKKRTGQNLGKDPEAWLKWWEQNK